MLSIYQRSAQGALAPQRPPAQQADPLTAHPKLVKTVSVSWPSFLFTFHGVEPERARSREVCTVIPLGTTRLKPRKRVHLRGIMLTGLDTC